ncbi:UNVERIFIED_CONTAM: hypothetical protein GTU68_005224, partial [Idotea baltica]|nr:hypothetical protein [Idotea baltica]
IILLFLVGTGSGGGVVAGRLSEIASWKVLVLEAGGIPQPESTIPGLSFSYLIAEYNWNYSVKPQQHALFGYENNMTKFIIGKVLGGSSITNDMIYLRETGETLTRGVELATSDGITTQFFLSLRKVNILRVNWPYSR